MSDEIQDRVEEAGSDIAAALRRYVHDNPLATIAGAAIVGMLLARFAFLGNPKERP